MRGAKREVLIHASAAFGQLFFPVAKSVPRRPEISIFPQSLGCFSQKTGDCPRFSQSRRLTKEVHCSQFGNRYGFPLPTSVATARPAETGGRAGTKKLQSTKHAHHHGKQTSSPASFARLFSNSRSSALAFCLPDNAVEQIFRTCRHARHSQHPAQDGDE